MRLRAGRHRRAILPTLHPACGATRVPIRQSLRPGMRLPVLQPSAGASGALLDICFPAASAVRVPGSLPGTELTYVPAGHCLHAPAMTPATLVSAYECRLPPAYVHTGLHPGVRHGCARRLDSDHRCGPWGRTVERGASSHDRTPLARTAFRRQRSVISIPASNSVFVQTRSFKTWTIAIRRVSTSPPSGCDVTCTALCCFHRPKHAQLWLRDVHVRAPVPEILPLSSSRGLLFVLPLPPRHMRRFHAASPAYSESSARPASAKAVPRSVLDLMPWRGQRADLL